MMYAVAIMLVGLLVFQTVPDKLLGLFNASENMLLIGDRALRVISLSFLFAGFCIVIGSLFQALGNGVYSLCVSVARQLVVLLPAAFLLSLTGKVENVWWAFPIAEIMSLCVTLFFYRNRLDSYLRLLLGTCHIQQECPYHCSHSCTYSRKQFVCHKYH